MIELFCFFIFGILITILFGINEHYKKKITIHERRIESLNKHLLDITYALNNIKQKLELKKDDPDKIFVKVKDPSTGKINIEVRNKRDINSVA
tara:strand:+ start:160 stop:438 length:279 start_codon:yes stop_codon:yes gene_type:complete